MLGQCLILHSAQSNCSNLPENAEQAECIFLATCNKLHAISAERDWLTRVLVVWIEKQQSDHAVLTHRAKEQALIK